MRVVLLLFLMFEKVVLMDVVPAILVFAVPKAFEKLLEQPLMRRKGSRYLFVCHVTLTSLCLLSCCSPT